MDPGSIRRGLDDPTLVEHKNVQPHHEGGTIGQLAGQISGIQTVQASLIVTQDAAKFGSDVPMGWAGEPEEVAPCYVFLAADDSFYMTGQVLHPNGGEIVNG